MCNREMIGACWNAGGVKLVSLTVCRFGVRNSANVFARKSSGTRSDRKDRFEMFIPTRKPAEMNFSCDCLVTLLVKISLTVAFNS